MPEIPSTKRVLWKCGKIKPTGKTKIFNKLSEKYVRIDLHIIWTSEKTVHISFHDLMGRIELISSQNINEKRMAYWAVKDRENGTFFVKTFLLLAKKLLMVIRKQKNLIGISKKRPVLRVFWLAYFSSGSHILKNSHLFDFYWIIVNQRASSKPKNALGLMEFFWWTLTTL